MTIPQLKETGALGTYTFARFLNNEPLDIRSSPFQVEKIMATKFVIRDLKTGKKIFCGLPKNQKPNGKEWQTSELTADGFQNTYSAIFSGGEGITNKEVVIASYSFHNET